MNRPNAPNPTAGSPVNRVRKRKAQEEEKEGYISFVPSSGVPTRAFSSSFDTFGVIEALTATHSAGHFLPPVGSASQAQPTATIAVETVSSVDGFNTDETSKLYGGNIAVACKATNAEVAQKSKEASVSGNEENQRKKAASRIVAWQSRERKRIEMEVLQEWQVELARRNDDLKSENERLRLLVERFKSATANPEKQAVLPPSNSLSGSTGSGVPETPVPFSGVQGRAVPNGNGEASQLLYATAQPTGVWNTGFVGDHSAVPSGYHPMIYSNFSQQQPPWSPTTDVSRPQHRDNVQQKPPHQTRSITAEVFSMQGPTSHNLLRVQDAVARLSGQRDTMTEQESTHMDPERNPISSPSLQPEDMRGVPPRIFPSWQFPVGNLHVDIPLIRALPRRKEPPDINEDTSEKEEGDG